MWCFALGQDSWGCHSPEQRCTGEPQRQEESTATEAHKDGALSAAAADKLG